MNFCNLDNEGLTYSGGDIEDADILVALPEEYRELLSQRNGFVLFSGGLHIRGAVHSPEWHSLRKVWPGDLALHKLFPAVEESDVPFGQDCLGDQFLLRGRVVHRLRAEYGEIESLALDLETFLMNARENPVEFLSMYPLFRYLSDGGEMKPGQLLNAYPPFVMKESANDVRLAAISMIEQISFLADFASQISDLPNGTVVKIKVINQSSNQN